MKKILTMSLAAAMLLPLASCDMDPDENKQIINLRISAFNLVTSVDDDASKPAVTSACSYGYNFESSNTANAVSLSSGLIPVPDGGSVTFTTVPMSCSQKMLTIGEKQYEAISFSAENPTKSGAKVTDFKGLLTQSAFLPGDAVIPDYELVFPGVTGHYAVFDYVLEDTWRVRTFWRDVTFAGTTTTTYKMNPNAPDKSFENKNMRYRVVMKTDRGELTNKADVIFYNARFAEEMKKEIEAIVLQNLDLTFDAEGYKISGKDIIPLMNESGASLPIPKYKFNSFELAAGGDLTEATVNYKVADVFKGSFRGACFAK